MGDVSGRAGSSAYSKPLLEQMLAVLMVPDRFTVVDSSTHRDDQERFDSHQISDRVMCRESAELTMARMKVSSLEKCWMMLSSIFTKTPFLLLW